MSHDQPTSPDPPAVLLVEDEPLVRLLSNDTLTAAGFHVIEACDAEEAIIMLEAKPGIAAVVTDVRMPGSLDGFALAHLVSNRWPQMGIVVTSAHAVPGEGDLPGSSEFLPKPYQPSRLIEAVRNAAGQAVDQPSIVQVPGPKQ